MVDIVAVDNGVVVVIGVVVVVVTGIQKKSSDDVGSFLFLLGGLRADSAPYPLHSLPTQK